MLKPEELGTGKTPDAWFWREGKDVATLTKTKVKHEALNEEGIYFT